MSSSDATLHPVPQTRFLDSLYNVVVVPGGIYGQRAGPVVNAPGTEWVCSGDRAVLGKILG